MLPVSFVFVCILRVADGCIDYCSIFGPLNKFYVGKLALKEYHGSCELIVLLEHSQGHPRTGLAMSFPEVCVMAPMSKHVRTCWYLHRSQVLKKLHAINLSSVLVRCPACVFYCRSLIYVRSRHSIRSDPHRGIMNPAIPRNHAYTSLLDKFSIVAGGFGVTTSMVVAVKKHQV